MVTGVTTASFDRSNQTNSPARVSDFRLDTYEITVGRFRKFVAAYAQTMTAPGAGKNPSNPSDTGWNTTWNSSLDTDATALITQLKCAPVLSTSAPPTNETWTDQVGNAASESVPINCLNWFEAEAFCIWDGGRLPTEAEWNYAAAGGTEQRFYPWGSSPPDCSYANFVGAMFGTSPCFSPVSYGAPNRVGSESPKGDGKFGQADLAGNVWEWVQDWYANPYANPCNDCADLTASTYRLLRGGSFNSIAAELTSTVRNGVDPSIHLSYSGARCARTR
ncbi:MAG TPA: formylglycine-generating enzyme family protein [Polyangiaceae bacterium]|nr:formylglycine-generating enzyme family protein [Polyangiaceae bacterium]